MSIQMNRLHKIRRGTARAAMVFCLLAGCVAPLAALGSGWQLNLRGCAGGSLTLPSISQSDLNELSANSLSGLLGYGYGGEVLAGYVWDTADVFGLAETHVFSGIGVFGGIGIAQGYAGQIAGANVQVGSSEEQVDVYMNIYYSPVVSFSVAGRAYFFDNRLAAGVSLGMSIITDTSPQYEMYSSNADAIPAEVGTILVDGDMMRTMNPVMGSIKLEIEYNAPVISTLSLVLGGYGAFNIYSPRYITMPQTLVSALQEYQDWKGVAVFNPKTTPLSSYFINSFDFGVTIGLALEL